MDKNEKNHVFVLWCDSVDYGMYFEVYATRELAHKRAMQIAQEYHNRHGWDIHSELEDDYIRLTNGDYDAWEASIEIEEHHLQTEVE